MQHFHIKLPCQKSMLRQIDLKSIKWTYQKERSFANNYFIFMRILFQFKSLIQRVDLISTFRKYCSFIRGRFSPMSILKTIVHFFLINGCTVFLFFHRIQLVLFLSEVLKNQDQDVGLENLIYYFLSSSSSNNRK